jgi:hypothetical protein
MQVWCLGIGLIFLGEACDGREVQSPSAEVTEAQDQDQAGPRPPIIKTAKATSAARKVTSTRSGNWSAPATWGGSSPPRNGDIAVINHKVTITADTTIGDGSSSTVLDVTNGTLTVTGATLTLRGNAIFGKYTGGTAVTRLSVNSSSTVPGGLVFDGASGVAPCISAADDTRFTFTGTSGVRAFVNTLSSTLGNPGYITSTGSNRSLYMNAAYCDFARLGTGTTAGITSGNLGSRSVGNEFTLDNCTFDSCGTTPSVGITDGAVNISITNCTWTNTVTGAFSMNFFAMVALTRGTRLVNNCLFYSQPGIWQAWDFTITNSYFGEGLICAGGTHFWNTFDGNFVRRTQTNIIGVMGGISNCYLLAVPAAATTTMQFLLLGQLQNSNVTGNVCQYIGSASGPGNSFFGETEGKGPDRTYTFTNNIVIPPQGGGSMSLGGENSNLSLPWTNYSDMEHNTICTNASDSNEVGGVIGQKSNTVTLKSNIFYNTNGVPGNYAFNNIGHRPAPVDALPAANADYNGWFGLASVPKGTWNDIADGTVYSSPMSGTVAPGAHDQPSADPQFRDASRSLQTWDASLTGPGTIASALARIRRDPTLTKSSLLPYIRNGFKPTNPAYKGTAHDGGDIGAVPVVVPDSRQGS